MYTQQEREWSIQTYHQLEGVLSEMGNAASEKRYGCATMAIGQLLRQVQTIRAITSHIDSPGEVIREISR